MAELLLHARQCHHRAEKQLIVIGTERQSMGTCLFDASDQGVQSLLGQIQEPQSGHRMTRRFGTDFDRGIGIDAHRDCGVTTVQGVGITVVHVTPNASPDVDIDGDVSQPDETAFHDASAPRIWRNSRALVRDNIPSLEGQPVKRPLLRRLVISQ